MGASPTFVGLFLSWPAGGCCNRHSPVAELSSEAAAVVVLHSRIYDVSIFIIRPIYSGYVPFPFKGRIDATACKEIAQICFF